MRNKRYCKTGKNASIPPLRARAGFTVVETMVAIFIFLVVLAAAFLVLSTGRNTWWTSTTYIEVNQEIRKAKEWISKELQQGRRVSVAIGANNNSIQFDIPIVDIGTGAITWQSVGYSIGGLNNSQLMRTSDTAVKILSNNIDPNLTTFTQDLDNPSRITVAITANKQDKRQRAISARLDFDVNLRN
jgi:type II secretory pathway pseudopilin PulG